MPRSPIGSVLSYIQRLVDPGSATSTDRDLLTRFVSQRDETAFEALVRRHGPMVLAVCRRLLVDAEAADDAFQATFLVLVKKAAAVPCPERLAGWLHGVATRIAYKARHDRLRRQTLPLDFDIPAAEEPMDDVMRRELAVILDEEVAQLPQTYQTPFVLCHLAGRSNEEAARELGCPLGTIYSRLARARELLRARLLRRGLVLSTGTLTMTLQSAPAPAAVPAALLEQTVSAGRLLAAGQTLTAGVVSTQTLTFMEAALRAMYLAQVKWISVATMFIVVVGTSLGLAYRALGGAAAAPAAAPRVAAADPAAPPRPGPDSNDKLLQEIRTLQDRLKVLQERQKLEGEIQKIRAQVAALEGKGEGKGGAVTYRGQAVEHWLKQLRDCDPATRLSALRAMASIGEELGDDAPRVSVAITDILRTSGPVTILPERWPVVAVGPKKEVGPKEAKAAEAEAESMRGLFAQATPAQVQFQAIEALAAIGPAANVAVPKLVAMQLDELEVVHSMLNDVAARGTGAWVPADPAAALSPADPNEAGPRTIVPALLRIDPEGKRAVPVLLARIQKPKVKSQVALHALEALTAYGHHAAPAAVAVVNLLRDAEMRPQVYLTLEAMGDAARPTAVPALVLLAKGKDKATAQEAAGVLHSLWPAEAEKADIPRPPTLPAPGSGA
jgi:RNA polymerase sigma factor (sigma-70 family)